MKEHKDEVIMVRRYRSIDRTEHDSLGFKWTWNEARQDWRCEPCELVRLEILKINDDLYAASWHAVMSGGWVGYYRALDEARQAAIMKVFTLLSEGVIIFQSHFDKIIGSPQQ